MSATRNRPSRTRSCTVIISLRSPSLFCRSRLRLVRLLHSRDVAQHGSDRRPSVSSASGCSPGRSPADVYQPPPPPPPPPPPDEPPPPPPEDDPGAVDDDEIAPLNDEPRPSAKLDTSENELP